MRRAALLLALVALAGCGGGHSKPHRAPTRTSQAAPPPANRVVLWAAGDGADGSTVAKRLATRIAADHPERFLYLGDVYPSGSALDYRRRYVPVYGRLSKVTLPTTGNHEWVNRENGYQPYWRGVTGKKQPYWYSTPLAGWKIISLSSEAPHDAASAQVRWLRKQLNDPGTCRLAFWHKPRFSSGPHGDATDTAPFWRALRGHARLILGGHDHLLQRYRKRAGITELVAGAGGGVLYPHRSDSRLAFARSGVTGALRLVLEPGRATMRFVSVDGKVLDRSRVTCREK